MTNKIKLTEVFLEVTNKCNFNCTFCPYHLVSRKKGEMPKDRVFELLDEIDQVFSFQWISFHLYGEPLLYPDLLSVFSYALMKRMNINFTTNASLLTVEYLTEIIRTGVWRIVLSVQTPPDKFFARGTTAITAMDYQNHLENLVKTFLELQKKYPACIMEIHYLNSRKFKPGLTLFEDEDEMNTVVENWTDTIELKKEANGTKHKIKELVVNDPLEEETGILYQLKKGLFIRFKPAISFGNAIVDTALSNKKEQEKCFSANCFFPFSSLAILVNGDMVSCCLDYNGDNILGNVFNNGGVKAVYSGVTAQKFRKQFQEKTISSSRCQECLGGVFFGSPI